MRAYESYRPTVGQLCPACGARHYPASKGDGSLVWCDGSPAETAEETKARLAQDRARTAQERADRERDREAARIKRNARARHRRRVKADRHPIDAIDRGLPTPDHWPVSE